ncbi:glycosyltransferase [Streptomyces sp. NPDC007172]|uniref:glycosyltransferase n=1 Tax=Streptomyces sp. NPDC007172 TaxID=3364776 RepID=UPI00368E5FBC
MTGQWTVDPTPASLREPPAGRRVCLTLGLSFREVMGGDQASVPDLLEALAGLDAEVVATLDAGQLAEVGRVPDKVRVVDFVPLAALLPSCSAIVHQGGFGTAQNALAHGVPSGSSRSSGERAASEATCRSRIVRRPGSRTAHAWRGAWAPCLDTASTPVGVGAVVRAPKAATHRTPARAVRPDVPARRQRAGSQASSSVA